MVVGVDEQQVVLAQPGLERVDRGLERGPVTGPFTTIWYGVPSPGQRVFTPSWVSVVPLKDKTVISRGANP